MRKPSKPNPTAATVCPPPPVVSPTMVARFRCCRSNVNSSAAEKVFSLVRTYTGTSGRRRPGTWSADQDWTVFFSARMSQLMRCVLSAKR